MYMFSVHVIVCVQFPQCVVHVHMYVYIVCMCTFD